MSVLIKGGLMPKTCRECFDNCLNISAGCDHGEGAILNADEREPGCPLVEVPEPHGRLIDEDELGELIHRMWVARQITNTKYNTFNDILDITPIVIEAEGE